MKSKSTHIKNSTLYIGDANMNNSTLFIGDTNINFASNIYAEIALSGVRIA